MDEERSLLQLGIASLTLRHLRVGPPPPTLVGLASKLNEPSFLVRAYPTQFLAEASASEHRRVTGWHGKRLAKRAAAGVPAQAS